jgi:hypothetical protein
VPIIWDNIDCSAKASLLPWAVIGSSAKEYIWFESSSMGIPSPFPPLPLLNVSLMQMLIALADP